MLRITLERREGDTARLSLEGTIAGPWVEELRRACKAAGVAGTPVVLGMAGVSFVDSEGARLVRTLAEAGASVRDCSPFVRELLEGACDDPDEN